MFVCLFLHSHHAILNRPMKNVYIITVIIYILHLWDKQLSTSSSLLSALWVVSPHFQGLDGGDLPVSVIGSLRK